MHLLVNYYPGGEMNSTLNQPMLITTNRIQTIIQSRGSIKLSELESILDASYNLIFLAIYHLSLENMIKVRKGEWDFIISKS
ncbi:MAG: hypothetical protein A2Y48_02690 [Nitrospirae bacterium RIFCSPLOW2_12_42_9]|nr:MAG: hypothetical protein A2Y48_02690 [Nitrospirae bacterium RIFCSPLOW2_12_42_9]